MLQISALRKRLFVHTAGFWPIACLLAANLMLLPTPSFAQSTTTSAGAPVSKVALIPIPREIHEATVFALHQGVSIEATGRESGR